MGTKNNPGQFDCYQNAEPDEPMFVLLGRDKYAPTLVWLWSVLRELGSETPEKVKEARECAVAMMAWGQEHGKEVAGIGAAVLGGVFELIRCANCAVENAKNSPTNTDMVRKLLCLTKIDNI